MPGIRGNFLAAPPTKPTDVVSHSSSSTLLDPPLLRDTSVSTPSVGPPPYTETAPPRTPAGQQSRSQPQWPPQFQDDAQSQQSKGKGLGKVKGWMGKVKRNLEEGTARGMSAEGLELARRREASLKALTIRLPSLSQPKDVARDL